jgi:ribosomal protein S18 acetylase RimI-like enzyme
MVIDLASINDFNSWMSLVDKVKMNFPGLDSLVEYENYKQTLIKNINRGTAICAKTDESIVGILIFSKQRKILACMAIDPDYRKQGLATKMINFMFTFFENKNGVKIGRASCRERVFGLV